MEAARPHTKQGNYGGLHAECAAVCHTPAHLFTVHQNGKVQSCRALQTDGNVYIRMYIPDTL